MYDDNPELDTTSLKYALYARKSTDDSQRQVRSIGDQIAECEDLANRLGIKIVKPILQETRSAKLPGKRPIFTELLKDLRKGKYDGILAWHPDRLARNMKEGGEIIDMIDEEVIKDLKFVTHHFTPDANGKMLLGMSFVLSKQYSDDLSQKVTRGMRRGFAEGKSSGSPKHGYIRTEEAIYIPDGKNFQLIADAWQMRKKKHSLQAICNYLNDNGYGRLIKGKSAKRQGTLITMTPQILSGVFRDTFYFGLLIQAKQQADLRLIYDFKPVITEEEYNEVQLISGRKQIVANTRHSFYPLRGLVLCSICGRSMYAGASKGRHKRYLNYRCDNKLCTRKKRSIRAKEVFNYIYSLLDKGLDLTEADYKKYLERMTSVNDDTRVKIQTQIRSKQGAAKVLEREVKSIATKILEYDKSSKVWEINNSRMEQLDIDAQNLKIEIARLKDSVTQPEQDNLSLDQFLNLSKNTSAKLKAATEVGKDRICRILFLNLVVDEEKVVSHTWKEPYATHYKNQVLKNGQGETIDLEPLSNLTQSIIANWDAEMYLKAVGVMDDDALRVYTVSYEH